MPDQIDLESLGPCELQRAIADDAAATLRLLAYLDERDERHSGQISGATLAACCGVHSRTWRKWVSAGEMPIGAKRAIICAAYCRGHR